MEPQPFSVSANAGLRDYNLLDLSIQARSGDCLEITLEDGDVDDGRLGPAGP